MKRYPNLFLVGAPKCGTTSMAYYLGQHPDIFAPELKEPNYFGSDLTRIRGHRSEESYLEIYGDWRTEKFALDASPLYLCPREAPHEIESASINPRIMIMIRNPVDMCYSLYHQNKFNGSEFARSFEHALSLENKRMAGKEWPKSGTVEAFLYGEISRVSKDIERYQHKFGRENVIVTVLDDLSCDPVSEFKIVSNFLEIGTQYCSTIDYSVKNTAKRARSHRLGWFAVSPPRWAGRLTGPFLSKAQRLKIRNTLSRINTIPSNNPAMDPKTRRLLAKKFAPEVERLSSLLDRDLTHWSQVDE